MPGFELVEGPGHARGADVRDVFILDTLASIDGVCSYASHSSSPNCRPTADEKVLTDMQRAGAGDAMTLKEGHDLRSARPRL